MTVGVLLTGDTGTGKTTAALNLAVKYVQAKKEQPKIDAPIITFVDANMGGEFILGRICKDHPNLKPWVRRVVPTDCDHLTSILGKPSEENTDSVYLSPVVVIDGISDYVDFAAEHADGAAREGTGLGSKDDVRLDAMFRLQRLTNTAMRRGNTELFIGTQQNVWGAKGQYLRGMAHMKFYFDMIARTNLYKPKGGRKHTITLDKIRGADNPVSLPNGVDDLVRIIRDLPTLEKE